MTIDHSHLQPLDESIAKELQAMKNCWNYWALNTDGDVARSDLTTAGRCVMFEGVCEGEVVPSHTDFFSIWNGGAEISGVSEME